MAKWTDALAVVAALAAGAGVVGGAYLAFDALYEPGSAPEPTVSATPSPSPTATAAVEGCVWDALADEERPPLLEDEPVGLPAAREMTAETWECVDATWTVEARTADDQGAVPGTSAQAMYLVAPDGDLLKLFSLRTDIGVQVLESDVEARLAWTARVTGADTYQVVQVELETGLVIEDWGGDAIPELQRTDREGIDAVVSVAPLGEREAGSTLWGGYSYRDTVQSLFWRDAADAFRAIGAQRAIDGLVDQGAVNGVGEPGVELWVDQDLTAAVVLAQRIDEDGASLGGTWVAIDLVTDEWSLEEASLPAGLCAVPPNAGIAPDGTLPAVCGSGDESEVYDLEVGGDPVPRVEAGP